ncbi:MAG: hypothetical protein WBB29_05570 [Geitlerinemataceae cyanobacterium]
MASADRWKIVADMKLPHRHRQVSPKRLNVPTTFRQLEPQNCYHAES